MTIRNCPECGGDHFGSTRCPMNDPPQRVTPSAMAGRLRAALPLTGLSPLELSRVLGADYHDVRRWCNGQREPPENVVVWLEGLAAWHAAHPVPVMPWGRKLEVR